MKLSWSLCEPSSQSQFLKRHVNSGCTHFTCSCISPPFPAWHILFYAHYSWPQSQTTPCFYRRSVRIKAYCAKPPFSFRQVVKKFCDLLVVHWVWNIKWACDIYFDTDTDQTFWQVSCRLDRRAIFSHSRHSPYYLHKKKSHADIMRS